MQKMTAMVLFAATACIGCSQGAAQDHMRAPRPQSAGTRAPTGPLTLCQPGEVVIFSCHIRGNGKVASLCAAKDFPSRPEAPAYYAFGRPEKIELRYPKQPAPAGVTFKRTHLVFAGATGGYAYSFTNDGFRYHVYSISGTQLEDQGIVVERQGKVMARVKCDQRSVVRMSSPTIDAFLGWDEDNEVAEHGVP